jgi:hypothetical protein
MAHGSQHTVQIMETQTRFDLNTAIAEWQQELVGQPELTPVVRRELETHLRDTVAELQARGLNNEESFWLARRRVGPSKQLGEEFAKAGPASVWRERIFWMVLALLVLNLWTTFCNPIWLVPRFIQTRFEDVLPGSILFHLPAWFGESHVLYPLEILLSCIRYIPILLLAVFLAKGRLKLSRPVLHFFGTSRKRFFLVAFSAFLLANSVNLGGGETFFSFQLDWTLPLIVLATWLIPTKKETVVRAV